MFVRACVFFFFFWDHKDHSHNHHPKNIRQFSVSSSFIELAVIAYVKQRYMNYTCIRPIKY